MERLDDPEPEQQLWVRKKQCALADASKPIEPAVEAIWATDPDKLKARKAIEDNYRKAALKGKDRDSHGELRARYERGNDKFIEVGTAMLHNREGKVGEPEVRNESHLAHWINTYMAPGTGAVWQRLRDRQQLGTRLSNRLGEREKKRQVAAVDTEKWEKAFGRWSAPDKEITRLIASYEGLLDPLAADIATGNNRALAIFSFWFEVAPIHLQLRDETVTDENAPGVQILQQVLKEEFSDLVVNYIAGKDRQDGSVYLIDPDELPSHRQAILARWQSVAQDQADAEADYVTRPDAAADLKPRYDELKDDGWINGAKQVLAMPKP